MSQTSIYLKTGLLTALVLMTAGLMMACGSTPDPVSNPPTVEPEAEVAVVPPPTPTTPPTVTPPPAIIAPDDGCIDCHSNQDVLMATAEEEEVVESLSEGEGWGGSVPPLEGWEKVILSYDGFTDTIHGELGCVSCHGGNGITADKAEAHTDMRREPPAAEACDQCHSDMHNEANSLHSTLQGYYTVIQQRASPETWPHVEEAFGNHCESCHTSCGQCHVSRPTNLGGGLTGGHEFKKIPPMNLTCTGCHGSRVDMEYKGKNEGIPADIHWNQGGMPCFQCHSADEMHGNLGGAQPNHRYDGPQTVGCSDADCHADITDDGTVEGHDADHLATMSCETCHAAEYKSCYSCHVQKSDEGVPYFKIEPSVMNIKLGYNPRQSEERPWKWVTLRHVPIDPDTFAYYGDNLLPNFDSLPTWVYATPHTTQRRAPQAQSCNDCHGNADLFLTKDDLLPYEIEANQDVIVDEADIPAPVAE